MVALGFLEANVVPITRTFVHLALGQSNNTGIGQGSYLSSTTSRHDFKLFQVPYGTQSVVPLTEPVLFWEANAKYHGHVLSLARLIALDLPDDTAVCVVPAAKNGSSVLEWNQKVLADYDVWQDTLVRLAAAMAQPGAYVGLCDDWQGETDIFDVGGDPVYQQWHDLMPDVATWKAEKLAFIDKVRATVGASVPITLGKFCPDWIDYIQTRIAFEAAVDEIVSTRPLCGTVSVADLRGNALNLTPAPTVHFSAASQECIAGRVYAAYRALIR